MPAPIYWPHTILRPGRITRHIAARTIAGTVAASGFTQRVSVPAHSWVIQYDNIVVATAEQLRWWDYVSGVLDGGANSVFVPLLAEDNGGAVNGSVVTLASTGASAITLSRSVPILAGYHFSVGEYLFRVIGATPAGGSTYSLTIRPPLRNGVVAGATAYFV